MGYIEKEFKKELAKFRFIKGYAALNNNCPLDILEELSINSNWLNRYCVVKNPNCPLSIIEKLTKDTNNYIVELAYKHPKCTTKLMLKAIDIDGFEKNAGKNALYTLPYVFVKHINCSVEILEKLADRNMAIFLILKHPLCTLKILENYKASYPKLVAKHPNCSEEILREVASCYLECRVKIDY
jgi:hypothetical protein